MRRATSLTDAPGANASATIARFCSSLHRRRRSGPDITSTRLIAPSLAPVQNTSLAPVPEQAGSIPRAQGGRYRTVTPNVPLHGLQDRPIGNNGYSSSPTSRKSSVAMSAATRRRKRLSTSSIGPKGANDEQNLQNRQQN